MLPKPTTTDILYRYTHNPLWYDPTRYKTTGNRRDKKKGLTKNPSCTDILHRETTDLNWSKVYYAVWVYYRNFTIETLWTLFKDGTTDEQSRRTVTNKNNEFSGGWRQSYAWGVSVGITLKWGMGCSQRVVSLIKWEILIWFSINATTTGGSVTW